MSGPPPTIRPPTPEELREKAAAHFIDLSEDELADFVEAMPGLLALYERLDELPTPRPGIEFTDRDPGYRPPADENPHNAFVTRCRVDGAADGPLAGYTVGLKDNIALAGVEMTCGSRLMEGYVPQTDATVATRLLAAGATIVGKLNMEDMAFSGSGELSAFGPVSNPAAPDHLAGGSSSGSAAAVVAGEVDVALGGDQAGSIRIPASWCGCVGLKPTYGLVPYTGIVGLGDSFDHTGPMTRSARDCALALNAIAGPDPLDDRQGAVTSDDYVAAVDDGLSTCTIGLLEEGFGLEESDSEVDGTVREAFRTLAAERDGVTLRDVSVPWHEDGLAIWNAVEIGATTALVRDEGVGHFTGGYYDTQFAEAFGRARRTQADDLPPTLKLALVVGEYLADEYHGRYYAKAQNLRRELARAYDDALAEVDLLALPTTPQTAHERRADTTRSERIARSIDMLGNTSPFNMSGHPAISVPCGTADGLPVGAMLVGGQFDDATVLRAADALEGSVGESG